MAALTYGVVCRAKPGNSVSGDSWRVLERPEQILVAVIDGLGSGALAAAAAEAAGTVLDEAPEQAPDRLLEACNEALQQTRGAAMGLLLIEPKHKRVRYAGVGNIEVRTSSASNFRPISTGGIVGTNYRPPRVFEAEYLPGEWLVIHSDGISCRFDLDEELRVPFASAQVLAERLALKYGRDNDDVTLVAIRLP